jgi:hypothetical protein
MVKPNLASRQGLGRRIRLTGLLRKPLQMGGFYLAVHHRCITTLAKRLGLRVETDSFVRPDPRG